MSPDDRAPPKGALEEAVALFDECFALATEHSGGVGWEEKIADFQSRRAALEPRLAKRRENQAKPRARCNSGRGYQEGEREVDIPKRERGGKS